jgi:hypothetical protein
MRFNVMDASFYALQSSPDAKFSHAGLIRSNVYDNLFLIPRENFGAQTLNKADRPAGWACLFQILVDSAEELQP